MWIDIAEENNAKENICICERGSNRELRKIEEL
jgi:hypothetical protein